MCSIIQKGNVLLATVMVTVDACPASCQIDETSLVGRWAHAEFIQLLDEFGAYAVDCHLPTRRGQEGVRIDNRPALTPSIGRTCGRLTAVSAVCDSN